MPQINTKYSTVFVEAQQTYVTQDPDGNKFTIFQGQQFKFKMWDIVPASCGQCGNKKRNSYIIDAYAHCCDGEYLWPVGGSGRGIYVYSDVFIETDNLKLPPITTSYEDERSGKLTDLFTPPWERKIPREGGLWVTDPWYSRRDD